MLLPAVVLDTAMTASQALARLARHGYWLDAERPESRAWIEATAERVASQFVETERRLARDPSGVGVALRRQWGMQVLWYSRLLDEVLLRLGQAPPERSLLDALGLHEPDSRPPIRIAEGGRLPAGEGVVLMGDEPVGVSVALEATRGPTRSIAPPFAVQPPAPPVTRGTRGGVAVPAPDEAVVRAWPRLEAPVLVSAGEPFTVVVGLGREAQALVAGGRVEIAVPAGASGVDVGVELIADGVEAVDGWSRSLRVEVADPTAASVRFTLVGLDPVGSEGIHLTTLEVRYLHGGAVCGTASRALVIGPAGASQQPPRLDVGEAWLDRPQAATPILLQADPLPADLTIEIAKPDGNHATGRYQCRLFSPHPLPDGAGPFTIDLGEDARTFARSIVAEVRTFADDPLVDSLLLAAGMLIADKLPRAVFAALRGAAAAAAPRAPAVLLVSADPYVPWELAHVDPPLDLARPPFLGAQVVLGRWLRDTRAGDGDGAGGVLVARPPANPPATIGVRHMAVMAGLYQSASGLRRLPAAEAEALALAEAYDAVRLAASTQDIARLLQARLTHGFQEIGGVEAIHFAGHGDVDASVADGSVLMLSEGRPLPSLLFRSARFGPDRQPLFFLNACMIGVGGELLGDMGGFPGNCLKGGVGALLGALWEIDDGVAREFATEFWRRALPTDDSPAESIGEVLRDLRGRYGVPAHDQTPVHTWLAYVYYGHPRLTLQRVR
jgi:hypothetical protein